MSELCEIRWCESGAAGTVRVSEAIEDQNYSVMICRHCALALGVKEGDQIDPNARNNERILEVYYNKYFHQPHDDPFGE